MKYRWALYEFIYIYIYMSYMFKVTKNELIGLWDHLCNEAHEKEIKQTTKQRNKETKQQRNKETKKQRNKPTKQTNKRTLPTCWGQCPSLHVNFWSGSDANHLKSKRIPGTLERNPYCCWVAELINDKQYMAYCGCGDKMEKW